MNLKSQGYDQWNHSDSFKQDQLKIAELTKQNQLLLEDMERKQKKDEYYNLKLTNLQSSDENTTHAASPLQMKLKFNNIGGSLEESIHKENSPTVSTARQIAGFTPRQKIVLNEVKGFHEEKDILNSS